MRAYLNPAKHAFMYLGYEAAWSFASFHRSRSHRFVKIRDLPRAVAIVSTEAAPGVIKAPILVLCGICVEQRVRFGAGHVLEVEPRQTGFGQNPGERNVGERIIGVSTANVCVHAREPDLQELLVLCVPCRAG